MQRKNVSWLMQDLSLPQQSYDQAVTEGPKMVSSVLCLVVRFHKLELLMKVVS